MGREGKRVGCAHCCAHRVQILQARMIQQDGGCSGCGGGALVVVEAEVVLPAASSDALKPLRS